MRRKILQAAKPIALYIACMVPQVAAYPAQEPETPRSEIYGPPIYDQRKLSDHAVAFVDREIGFAFILPPDWMLGNNGPRFMDHGWRGGGDGNIATTIRLHRLHTDEDIWLYYALLRHVIHMTPDQTDKWLMEEADDKISERRIGDKLKGYRVRPSSYESRQIDGHRALAWVADFTEGKIAMVEYEVYVRSDSHIAEVFARCPAGQLDAVRKDVEAMTENMLMQ